MGLPKGIKGMNSVIIIISLSKGFNFKYKLWKKAITTFTLWYKIDIYTIYKIEQKNQVIKCL
jgi:hypothetical protein